MIHYCSIFIVVVNYDCYCCCHKFYSLSSVLYLAQTVQISGAKTRNGELVPVFEVNQVLHAEKSFEEWAEVFCQEYFSVHAADPSGNAFLINALDLKYCVAITLYSLEMSSIEHGIRQ